MEQMHLLLLVQVMVIQIFFLVVAEVVPNLIQVFPQVHPQEETVVEVLVEEQQLLMVVELDKVVVMVMIILVVEAEDQEMVLPQVLQQVLEDLV